MNHYNKPPLTIEQHINQLEKRGLIITDSVVAEQYLTNNDPHAFMNTELFNDPWKHQRQLTKVTNELKTVMRFLLIIIKSITLDLFYRLFGLWLKR